MENTTKAKPDLKPKAASVVEQPVEKVVEAAEKPADPAPEFAPDPAVAAAFAQPLTGLASSESDDVVSQPDTVVAVVPRTFTLRVSTSQEIRIEAGTQRMTREQAEHWYSKANGVTIFED